MSIGKKLKGIGCYILMLVIFVPLLKIFFMPDMGKEYFERGIKTEATVTSVFGLRGKQYYGVYQDSKGNLVDAEIIVNKPGVMVGDVVEGYILAEEPYKVWCEPPEWVNILLKVLIGLFLLLIGGSLVFVPVFLIIAKRKERVRNKKIWEEGMREFRGEDRW